jgi:hypothetical protein
MGRMLCKGKGGSGLNREGSCSGAEHAGDSDNEQGKSPPASDSIFSLRPPVSRSAVAAQHTQGTLQCWKASSSGYRTTCELFSTDDMSICRWLNLSIFSSRSLISFRGSTR